MMWKRSGCFLISLKNLCWVEMLIPHPGLGVEQDDGGISPLPCLAVRSKNRVTRVRPLSRHLAPPQKRAAGSSGALVPCPRWLPMGNYG
jgi:hypothetical protein